MIDILFSFMGFSWGLGLPLIFRAAMFLVVLMLLRDVFGPDQTADKTGK